MSSPKEIVDWVYQKEAPVQEIAALAPLVFAAYKKGDQQAVRLVNNLIGEMILDIKTVARETDLLDKPCEVGLTGGIFQEPLAQELLKTELKKIMPFAKIILPKISPAIAAAKMAQNLASKGGTF